MVHLQNLKTLRLTDIRARFAQRQLLVSNFCQGLYGRYFPSDTRKAIEPPPVNTPGSTSQQYKTKKWKNNKDARRAYYMKVKDPGGGPDEDDNEFKISV